MTQLDETTTRVQQWVNINFPLAAKRNLSPGESLLDGGIIDSMGVLEVVQFLEDEYGIEVTDDEMVDDHFDSIDSIARFVDSKTPAS